MKNFDLKWLMLAMLTVVMAVSFNSCGDDDKDEPAQSGIVGKWICYKSVEYGQAYDSNTTVEFFADNSVTISNAFDNGLTLYGTYSYAESGALTITYIDEDGAKDTISATVKITGNEAVVEAEWDHHYTLYLKRI